jgi:hypothetical protein
MATDECPMSVQTVYTSTPACTRFDPSECRSCGELARLEPPLYSWYDAKNVKTRDWADLPLTPNCFVKVP